MMTPQQLSLSVGLNDGATFENFYAPPATVNSQVLLALRQQIETSAETLVFLWGASGSGLTHLLQGACHHAQACHKSFQYFPLRELEGCTPDELFLGLESLDLIVLDGIDEVVGRASWEMALFNLFNRLRDANKLLLIAAARGPQELPISLPDLKSRLQWGTIFHVHTLDDGQKQAALQLRARARGLELSDEVAIYIIQRLPRDMNALFLQLDRLDQASLAEQRKLTIPFVKKILGV